MIEIASFFRPREKHSGETYCVDIDSTRLYAYSRKPLQSRLLKQAADRKELDRAQTDLRSAISQSGGGVIVTATPETNDVRVGFDWIGPNSDGGREFVVLSPGRPPRFDQGDQRLSAGSHVVVPVDQDAEEALHQFIEDLAWLSPDLESLVLNSIRRPSIDARLNRVEHKLFKRTADEQLNDGWLRRKMAAVKRAFSPAVFGTIVAVVIAFLLGLNAYLLGQLSSTADDAALENAYKAGSKAAKTGTVAETAPTREKNGAFADEARLLLHRLHEKSATNPDFKLLYDIHFAESDRGEPSDEQIAKLFEAGKNNRPFLWGVIKLQALKLEPKPTDQAFLKGVEEISATKKRFTEIGMAKIMADAAGLNLLATLACRLEYNTPEAPGLPKAGEIAAFEFVPNGDCSQFNSSADIERGLAGLIEFLERDVNG